MGKLHLRVVEKPNRVRESKRRSLWIAFGVNAVYALVEVMGGIITGSLALLADAGHMFSDVVALGISIFAVKLAEKPPTLEKTYGYHRAEVLAALINGLTLWLIAGLIFHEAYHRLFSPPEVKGFGMLFVATVGLGINIGVALVLRKRAAEDLNLKGAFLHVVADILGSIGAIVAALAILITGWNYADPIIGVLIAILILYSSWELVRDSVDILMEGTPKEIKLEDVRCALIEIPGIHEVHDLHVWSLTSGKFAFSAHAVVKDLSQGQSVLGQASRILSDQFRIGHTTLQLEEIALSK
ncbi:MAG: cation diffusion facilitator family transporter [Nitrospiria bacterium]